MSNSTTPWTVVCQAPLCMGFPRQEYWSGLPFLSPGDIPDPGIEPGLLHCRQFLYHLSHQGNTKSHDFWQIFMYFWILHSWYRTFPSLWNTSVSLFTADPVSGRSPGERNGNPLQYFCLENPMHRGAWQTTVHGVAQSGTWLKRLNDNK